MRRHGNGSAVENARRDAEAAALAGMQGYLGWTALAFGLSNLVGVFGFALVKFLRAVFRMA